MAKDIKFELTSESIVNLWGVTLFRIKATVDIKERGVKKGELGGFVESTHLSNGNARVSGNAWVYGNAEVSGNAQVYGNAEVYGDAQIYNNARVFGNAQVFGNAWVSGNAWVYNNAWVFGNAQVYGNAEVSGDAQIYNNAWVFGNAEVSGNAWVFGNAEVSAKKAYTKGKFIGGIDGDDKVTNITDQTGTYYWDNQYVLGDYEIKDIDDEPTEEIKTTNPKEITIDGATYVLKEVL